MRKTSPRELPAPSAVDLDLECYVPETLFPDIRRKRVALEHLAPGGKYRSITKIHLRFEKQRKDEESVGGTGWLIDDDMMVTAGHCGLDWRSSRGRVVQMDVYIGYHGRASLDHPYVQSRYATRVMATPGWLADEKNRFNDVAFVKLNKPFTGVVPIRYMPTPYQGNVELGIVGYPLDIMDGATEEEGAFMFEEVAEVRYDLKTSQDHMLQYPISTSPGQSGSPVLIHGENTAIGTHAYGLPFRQRSNLASVINGSFGNDYDLYVELLDENVYHSRLPLLVRGEKVIPEEFQSLIGVLLSPQSYIPSDSHIIRACLVGDVRRIQIIFASRQAHPNDRTPDDVTVFQHAVRSGNLEVVRLCLDHGADPNLSFGSSGTSLLDNAFLNSNDMVIRLLLRARADSYYMNHEIWTSLFHLWVPNRPTYFSTNEIIDICLSYDFYGWNEFNPQGWTICHQAGAYGSGEDIYRLYSLGSSIHSYTTNLLWGPVTCAVWNGNESTFDAFLDLLSIQEILDIRDSRDWTLLHMAAQRGCRHILLKLLGLGADPKALTASTRYLVTENLRYKRLTAEEIARGNGHGELWDEIVPMTVKMTDSSATLSM